MTFFSYNLTFLYDVSMLELSRGGIQSCLDSIQNTNSNQIKPYFPFDLVWGLSPNFNHFKRETFNNLESIFAIWLIE